MLIMGVRWMDIGIWEPFCFKTRATMMSVLVYSSMSKSLGQGSRRSEERWWWGDRRHFLLLLIHSYRVPRKSCQITQSLKITEKVSFNIASEVDKSLLKMPKNGQLKQNDGKCQNLNLTFWVILLNFVFGFATIFDGRDSRIRKKIKAKHTDVHGRTLMRGVYRVTV